MTRLIALVIVTIPGIIAVIGFTWMRDAIFAIYHTPVHSIIFQFLVGLVFAITGILFVGGFIFHRDQKRNKVANRFRRH